MKDTQEIISGGLNKENNIIYLWQVSTEPLPDSANPTVTWQHANQQSKCRKFLLTLFCSFKWLTVRKKKKKVDNLYLSSPSGENKTCFLLHEFQNSKWILQNSLFAISTKVASVQGHANGQGTFLPLQLPHSWLYSTDIQVLNTVLFFWLCIYARSLW